MVRPSRVSSIVKLLASFLGLGAIGVVLCVGSCVIAIRAFGSDALITEIVIISASLAFIAYGFWLFIWFHRKGNELDREYRPWAYNKFGHPK